MRKFVFFGGAVLVLAACGSGPKGPPVWNPNGGGPPSRDENYHGGQNAMLLKYDADHDGTVTHDDAKSQRDQEPHDEPKSGRRGT